MRARCRSSLAAATLLVAAFAVEGTGAAQTVMEVQGGGSSLVGGYGVTTNFWRNGTDGWIGLGYLDGVRAGAFLRTGVIRLSWFGRHDAPPLEEL